uniref:Triple QxxK/R motif-containing protein n=1 Tax=Caenorhabditis tropicalis TaxID=1561998 RepID=A0A1I7TS88_9PELO
MADDNVSFTDVGDQPANTKGGASSAMLDILGQMDKKKNKKKKEKKAKKSKKKEKKGKMKLVRKVDKYESQNFLYRVEGSLFCAGIIIAVIMILVFVILGIIFGVKTNGNLVSYMQPIWGADDEATDDSGMI